MLEWCFLNEAHALCTNGRADNAITTVVKANIVQWPPGSMNPHGFKIISTNIGNEKINEIQKRVVILITQSPLFR